MQRLILRWAINALALYLAIGTGWISGIHPQNTQWWAILGLALVFGVVHALLRPLLKFLTCPLILITLGLFTLIINTALFWFTGWMGQYFNIGFTVEGFWPAFWGGLLVGVASAVLSVLLRSELKKD